MLFIAISGDSQPSYSHIAKFVRELGDEVQALCRLNAKGQELKSNLTDPDSAKMATSKGVIQGYAAQAAVDSAHQIIVAADVIGSGSEQAMLLPMVERSAIVRQSHTLFTADAGYYSDANVAALHECGIALMLADNGMRQRDVADPSQRMREAIDSPNGRQLYSRRIATVEPVFANIHHHKRMSRFTLRGQAKVSTQWNLFCLVHNIEKMARYG